VEYRVLGPLEVLDARGRRLSLGGAKQQSVLASLLLRAGRTVALERVIDELWEEPPETASRTIQAYISRLRHELPDGTIESRPSGWAIMFGDGEFDLVTFERRAEEGRSALAAGDHERAAKLLREALALWRGPALAGLTSEALRRERERLEEERTRALEDRLEADLCRGRHYEIVSELQALVAEHPFRERPRALLMRALYRAGRQTEALDVYQRARQLLHEELGLEPSPSLRDLHQAILRQAPSLAAETPAASKIVPSPSPSPTTLPVQPTRFVGRKRELAEVLALLRDPRVRLLTLTGAGGSGKTRLAIAAAGEAADDYPDGVFWAPLQALRDPELVDSAVAQAFGATEAPLDELTSKSILLVVDNFEQVMSAAEKLSALCARLPGLKLLVTSREPLHLALEHEYPVHPLAEPEAVSLFSERARTVEPAFEEDETVLEICQRLDCLPLALELAAVRVKALSVKELLQRLDKRLPLLTGGPRDAPERQRTLRATISWSYDLLDPDEKRLFADLSVFAGGNTLEAAERVCDANVDSIGALVDKSLLRRERERYYMLETLHEFASERLAERSDEEALRRRHSDYYLELGRSVEDQIPSPKAARLLDQLEPDHDNVRAALAWSSGETTDQPLRLAVWGLAGRLHGFGDVALEAQNPAEAGRLYLESLEVGHSLGDERHIAYCLAGLAAVEAYRGRRDVAARLWGCVRAFEETSGATLHGAERARYEKALDEFEQAPDEWPDFDRGRSMTLSNGVEFALANLGAPPEG
jgi:predicted ATPase/DNA-binding SARP family transcriptional activator